MSKPKKGSWIVRMKVTSIHTLVCETCTEDEARKEPYAYVLDDHEDETIDLEVISVEENK